MPPKKTTTKAKTTPKKATTKKVVEKVTPTPGVKSSLLGWALACLFAGAFVGTLIHGLSWSQHTDEASMFVANGYTWMPVKGEPLSVTILNDSTCGPACDSTQAMAALRQNISPAIITSTVDITSKEGQKLAEKFQIKSLPQFFFGKSLADFESDDEETKFIENLPEGFFVQKEGLYHLNNTAVGFKIGKFIEPPAFADLDSEPTKGSGPITVVEFTDYQCPYCKRLYDNNKGLIDQLIADNKITYVVKDFPLNFHAEAVEYTHAIANCTLKEGGADAFWAIHQVIFDQTDQWSGKGAAGKEFLIGQASELGVDVTACLADPATAAEIGADQAEGYLYGVSGTPALFIGEQVMPGAIGPEAFQAAVDAAGKSKK